MPCHSNISVYSVHNYLDYPSPSYTEESLSCHSLAVFTGEALYGDMELCLKDRKICLLILFYDKTVLFG